jgi:hypothetical protein
MTKIKSEIHTIDSIDGGPTCEFEFVPSVKRARLLYVRLDGRRIAVRGRPGTPQARTWVSLEPGYRVLDAPNREIVIEYNGARVH